MPKLIRLEPVATYATEANAIRATNKAFLALHDDLRYIIQKTEDGRYFPVFIGDRAIQAGVHFHFCVIN